MLIKSYNNKKFIETNDTRILDIQYKVVKKDYKYRNILNNKVWIWDNNIIIVIIYNIVYFPSKSPDLRYLLTGNR